MLRSEIKRSSILTLLHQPTTKFPMKCVGENLWLRHGRYYAQLKKSGKDIWKSLKTSDRNSAEAQGHALKQQPDSRKELKRVFEKHMDRWAARYMGPRNRLRTGGGSPKESRSQPPPSSVPKTTDSGWSPTVGPRILAGRITLKSETTADFPCC
jgi:hypothetical protein